MEGVLELLKLQRFPGTGFVLQCEHVHSGSKSADIYSKGRCPTKMVCPQLYSLNGSYGYIKVRTVWCLNS